jgi:hypothetical protein
LDLSIIKDYYGKTLKSSSRCRPAAPGRYARPPSEPVICTHAIERGKVFPVCGNTWRMLKNTRFAPYFDFIGDFSTHNGIFAGCGTSIPLRYRRR